jgi:hypothetical protein
MVMLPTTEDTPVIRTDFSDQAAWEAVCAAILASGDDGELFAAHVEFVDDPDFDGRTPEQLLALVTDEIARHGCLFIVDQTTVSSAVQPVLVVDLCDEKGRTLRTIPDALHSIQANLSIGNMYFAEFADAAGDDGVFRGFGGPSRSELKSMLPPFMLNPSQHRTDGS